MNKDSQSYVNVAEAIKACDYDNECRFVTDFGCDNGKTERLWLCGKNAPKTREGACLYEKPGSFLILPTVITKILICF